MSDTVFGGCIWDATKAATNLVDHGVSFEEAALALDDIHALIEQDTHDNGNLIAICATPSRVLFVVHCERGEQLRIISARKASDSQVERYRRGG